MEYETFLLYAKKIVADYVNHRCDDVTLPKISHRNVRQAYPYGQVDGFMKAYLQAENVPNRLFRVSYDELCDKFTITVFKEEALHCVCNEDLWKERTSDE